jgi:riboflavin biosynthesis pyrimidine reductase
MQALMHRRMLARLIVLITLPLATLAAMPSHFHFSRPDIGGDHIVVSLGQGVPDNHLAELATDGVSYIVADEAKLDLGKMLDALGREFGIRRLLLEGGATINGSFFAAGLVDELSLLVAPALDGRAGTQSFVEFGEAGLADKVQLTRISCEALEHGVLHVRYTLRIEPKHGVTAAPSTSM